MTPHIQWTNAGFRELSSLSESLAHKILRETDLLRRFPIRGASMEHRYRNLVVFRQLVVDRNWRVIYGYVENDDTLYILTIQSCRWRLPSARELTRRMKDFE